jgi:hypothetical protein
MEPQSPAQFRTLGFEIRFMYWSIIVATFLLGLGTYALTEDTDTYFAWTINPELSATFLGAGYWAGVILLLWSVRERYWARARVVIPVAFTLGSTLLLATFIHIGKFHTDDVIGWAWIISYSLLVPTLGYAVYRQLQMPGGDPPIAAPITGWFRTAISLQSAVMFVFGLILFVLPGVGQDIWPWKLSDLTSQAIGGVMLAHAISIPALLRENDWSRIVGPMLSYTSLAILHLIAIARYSDVLDFNTFGDWAYLGFVISILAVALYGLRMAWAARSEAESRPAGAMAVA